VFTPPKCKVRGDTFTLRKNYYKYVPFMHGKLSKTPEGTLITYYMEVDSITKSFDTVWIAGALPLALLFVLANILNGFLKGFTLDSILASLAAIMIPGVYYLLKRQGESYSEFDKKEMVEFLQKILEAETKTP
jgi:hypothetical protein